VLATVRELAPAGSAAILYRGLSALPSFYPDDDHESVPVEALREQKSHANAEVFSTRNSPTPCLAASRTSWIGPWAARWSPGSQSRGSTWLLPGAAMVLSPSWRLCSAKSMHGFSMGRALTFPFLGTWLSPGPSRHCRNATHVLAGGPRCQVNSRPPSSHVSSLRRLPLRRVSARVTQTHRCEGVSR
jgi:hypothetical protein